MASKWKLVEAVVAAFESAEPGAKVTANAQVRSRTNPDETRQVDVYVETNLGRRPIRMGVEVKDEKSPLDITKIEQVAAKLSDLDVDFRGLISTSAFTAGARGRAHRMGLSLSTMREVEDPSWALLPVVSSSAEPINVRINYKGGPPVEMKARMSSVAPDEIALVGRDGVAIPISTLAYKYGATALGTVDTPLIDQQCFAVRLDTPSEHWETLTIGGDRFPPPAHLVVIYRHHEKIEQMEMRTYHLDNREIHMTANPLELFGKPRHLGILAIPAESGTEVKLTVTSANPRPIVVGDGDSGERDG